MTLDAFFENGTWEEKVTVGAGAGQFLRSLNGVLVPVTATAQAQQKLRVNIKAKRLGIDQCVWGEVVRIPLQTRIHQTVVSDSWQEGAVILSLKWPVWKACVGFLEADIAPKIEVCDVRGPQVSLRMQEVIETPVTLVYRPQLHMRVVEWNKTYDPKTFEQKDELCLEEV